MTNDILSEKVDQYYIDSPDEKNEGSTIQDIEQIEKDIGILFPEDYKSYLLKYGSGYLESFPIFGLKPHHYMGLGLNTLTKVFYFYREQNWPNIESWIIVSDDSSGNPIGIAPDGKVYLSDHDCGFEQIKLADSFNEFLVKIIEDRIFDED